MKNKSGETVLIVDDEANIRSTLGSILLDEGYKVLTAGDGESAIKMVENEEPSVILLDIWLPQMDGMATLTEIKKINKHIPVVMMSGHGTVQTAVNAVRLGAFDFLEKPIDVSKLYQIITKIIHYR